MKILERMKGKSVHESYITPFLRAESGAEIMEFTHDWDFMDIREHFDYEVENPYIGEDDTRGTNPGCWFNQRVLREFKKIYTGFRDLSVSVYKHSRGGDSVNVVINENHEDYGPQRMMGAELHSAPWNCGIGIVANMRAYQREYEPFAFNLATWWMTMYLTKSVVMVTGSHEESPRLTRYIDYLGGNTIGCGLNYKSDNELFIGYARLCLNHEER